MYAYQQLAILDTTLRDGQLGPRQYKSQLIRMAEALAEAGMHRIELPIAYSEAQQEINDLQRAVEVIQSRGRLAVLHVRASREKNGEEENDIDKASKYQADGIAVYKALTDVHRNVKFKGQELEDAENELFEMVRYAKSFGFKYLRATIEDASRFYVDYSVNHNQDSLDYLIHILNRVEEEGADVGSIPDSASLMRPDWSRDMLIKVKERTRIPISVHFHNNFGLANDNTREAILAGANELQASYLGIADRNGTADIAETVIPLESMYGINTGIKKEEFSLYNLYKKLERLSGHMIPYRHIFSKEAMIIRAGTHTVQALKDKSGYFNEKLFEWVPDNLLRYVFNKYTSTKLVASVANCIITDNRLLKDSARKIRELSYHRGRNLTIDEVRSVMHEVTGKDIPLENFVNYVLEPKVVISVETHGAREDLAQIISEIEGVYSVVSGYGLSLYAGGDIPRGVDILVLGDKSVVDKIRGLGPDVTYTATMTIDGDSY